MLLVPPTGTLASSSKKNEPYRCRSQSSAGKSNLELAVYVDPALSRFTGASRWKSACSDGQDDGEAANSATARKMGRRRTRRRRRGAEAEDAAAAVGDASGCRREARGAAAAVGGCERRPGFRAVRNDTRYPTLNR
jgi:hypothetical protein